MIWREAEVQGSYNHFYFPVIWLWRTVLQIESQDEIVFKNRGKAAVKEIKGSLKSIFKSSYIPFKLSLISL